MLKTSTQKKHSLSGIESEITCRIKSDVFVKTTSLATVFYPCKRKDIKTVTQTKFNILATVKLC